MACLADGSAPYWAAVFGHFYAMRRTKFEYCIDRFTMENPSASWMLLNVILADHGLYGGGPITSIADMRSAAWTARLVLAAALQRGGDEFHGRGNLFHVMAWAKKDRRAPSLSRSHGQRAFASRSCKLTNATTPSDSDLADTRQDRT